MKTIIRLLTALCLILALLWGAILTSTSERAVRFFELAHKKVVEYGLIEKTKEKLTRTMNQVDRPAPEPFRTDEIIEKDLPEIKPTVKQNPHTPAAEIVTVINNQSPPEYDQVERELLDETEDSFSVAEQDNALSASDAIRILETLNIEKD